MKLSYLCLCALGVLALGSFQSLGRGFETVIVANGRSSAAATPPRLGSSAQSALGGLGKLARFLGELDVRTIRKAALEAFDAGDASVKVTLSDGSLVSVSAIPDYKTYKRQIAYRPADYASQTERLKDLLNDAWDESIARGYLEAPQKRTMFEFTGLDTNQRKASQLVYAPEGVFSVYMHGSPDSLSRHAIVLEHDPKNPQRAYQTQRKTLKLSTGETSTDDIGSSSISVEDVVKRIEKADMPEGVPLLFRACSAGGCPIDGLSIAQQVADRSNRPVVAASDIHYRPVAKKKGVGKVISTYVEGDTGPGEWRLFLPQSWHDDLPQSGSLRLKEDLRGSHELAILPDGAFSSIDLGDDLTDFSGRQNRGALLDAARKLEPGGTLRLRWSVEQLASLREATESSFRDKFLTAASAERIVALVSERLDPRTTLRTLAGEQYSVIYVQQGDNVEAIVRRL